MQRKIYRPYLSPFFSPPKRGSGLPACRLSGAYNTPTRRDGLGRGHIYISDHCDNLENLAPEAATNAARLEELPQKSQQLSIFTMGDLFRILHFEISAFYFRFCPRQPRGRWQNTKG